MVAGLPGLLHAETECVRLFDRLDEIEAFGGQSASEEELDNAWAMYDHMGCPRVPTAPGCQELSVQIRTMQASGLGNSNLSRERQQIMEELRRQGCMNGTGQQDWDKATEGARNPGLFQELYREGGGTESQRWRSAPDDGRTITFDGGGNYRTLCVRTCDGFYWPISFAARPGNFGQDEEMCNASCPKQAVSLYINRTGEGSETAKSLGGEPYTALPNAFLFRKRYMKECTCEAALPDNNGQADTLNSQPVPQAQKAVKPPAPPPANNEVEIYRSAPIIVGPSNRAQKSTNSNGLRGVSPEPLQVR